MSPTMKGNCHANSAEACSERNRYECTWRMAQHVLPPVITRAAISNGKSTDSTSASTITSHLFQLRLKLHEIVASEITNLVPAGVFKWGGSTLIQVSNGQGRHDPGIENNQQNP